MDGASCALGLVKMTMVSRIVLRVSRQTYFVDTAEGVGKVACSLAINSLLDKPHNPTNPYNPSFNSTNQRKF